MEDCAGCSRKVNNQGGHKDPVTVIIEATLISPLAQKIDISNDKLTKSSTQLVNCQRISLHKKCYGHYPKYCK